MKAVVYTEYGPPEVLKLKEVPKPVPKDNELLVKVHASTVASATLWARTGRHPDSVFFTFAVRLIFGLTKPKRQIMGYDLSGVVEAVGKDVRKFRKGDEVFGTTTGLKYGSYAEYVCLPERWKQGVVAKKPANISYEEAAAVPVGGMTSLYILGKANITKGQKVLIVGASGNVGTFAMQLARHRGAEVTGVCGPGSVGMVKGLGAKHVIDYTKEDFAKGGNAYDVVFETSAKVPASRCKAVLKKGGTFLSVKSPTKELTENLVELRKLIEAGKLKVAVDRSYPLEKTADAHRYVDKGGKKGIVVITMVPEGKVRPELSV